MKKTSTLKTAVTAFLGTAFAVSAGETAAKPNIVLILADDLGYECMGANGGTSYKTPEFDKLCERGMRFEYCYAQPLCTPSRVKLMTGMSNIRNYTKFGELDRSQVTFAQLLKTAGYTTCIAGKWQLGKEKDSPQHFGFDESLLWQHTQGRTDPEGHDTRYPSPVLEHNGKPLRYAGKYGPDILSDFVCDFMEKNKDRPFCVYYPMVLTHCPFAPTPDSPDWDAGNLGALDEKGETRYFGDMVTYMDKLIGKVVRKVSELGLDNDTLIIFTGDNGTDQLIVSEMNGIKIAGGKGRGDEAGTHVPLVAYWPGIIPENRICSDIVDFSDFFPTLCETAGIKAYEALDGRSFLPQLKGEPGNPRQSMYMWYNRGGGMTAEVEFARSCKYKLFKNGEFLDMTNGYNPLKIHIDGMNDEQKAAYQTLREVLDGFKAARPTEFARRNKQE